MKITSRGENATLDKILESANTKLLQVMFDPAPTGELARMAADKGYPSLDQAVKMLKAAKPAAPPRERRSWRRVEPRVKPGSPHCDRGSRLARAPRPLAGRPLGSTDGGVRRLASCARAQCLQSEQDPRHIYQASGEVQRRQCARGIRATWESALALFREAHAALRAGDREGLSHGMNEHRSDLCLGPLEDVPAEALPYLELEPLRLPEGTTRQKTCALQRGADACTTSGATARRSKLKAAPRIEGEDP